MLAAGTARGQPSRLREACAAREHANPARALVLGTARAFVLRLAAALPATFPAAAFPALEGAAALSAVLLYLPVTGFGFVFDDASLIGADGWPVPVGPAVPYRPLRYASYLVDGLLGGSAAVYHFDNLLLHALVAALVVALARRAGCGRGAALAGGLLVAVHPLAVEAVAYVSGRRDLLGVALGLGAMLALGGGRVAASAMLLVASAGAKESGLVFAAPLVAMTWTGLGGARQGDPRQWGARQGGSLPSGALPPMRPWAVRAVLATAVLAGGALALAYGAVGPWVPPAVAAAAAFPGFVAAHYLGGFLGLRELVADYPSLMDTAARLRGGDVAALAAGAAGTALLLLALAASAAACVRARPDNARHDNARPAAARRAGALAAAWIASVMLALAVGGGLHEPGADRHAYLLLPAVGFALALVVERSRGAVRGALFALLATSFVLAAASSREQMQRWASDRSLWSHAASQPLVSVRTHANLARALAHDGDWREARRHLDAAVAAEPADASLHLGRAAVHCAAGRRARARDDLDRARLLGAGDAVVAGIAADCPLPRLAEVLRSADAQRGTAPFPENAS